MERKFVPFVAEYASLAVALKLSLLVSVELKAMVKSVEVPFASSRTIEPPKVNEPYALSSSASPQFMTLLLVWTLGKLSMLPATMMVMSSTSP